MSTNEPTPPNPGPDSTPDSITYTSAEIVELIERVQREERQVSRFDRWIEFISAAILALATVATAWSGYQSSLWGGRQNDFQAAAADATVRSAQYANAAQQRLGFEASLFVNWVTAISDEKTELADFLYQRFPPGLKVATDAWMATKPRTNPDAPSSPFVMPEYQPAEKAEQQRWEAEAVTNREQANQASEVADRYVLLTVVFASVLFFGGIAGKFQSQRIDAFMLGASVVIFAIGLVLLATFPIK